MTGVYRPRHPERTVLYRVLFHHFDRFLSEYESRFEREYGFFRPIIKEVIERYLDCGNPQYGFARIRCPDCREERLVMFSCRTRGFCPSCHAKRLEEWGEWMRETLVLDVPHRQIVFTIPRMLRVFFKYKRRLLGDFCRLALRALTRYFEIVTGSALAPGVIAAIQTFGDRINFHPHLHFLVTEGGVDEGEIFHKIPRMDDARLAEIFSREVLIFLVGKELLSPEWAGRLLSWRHTGFNVHSRVRTRTKIEAERVGKYMIRPVLALERLTFLEQEGKVGYRWGRDGAGQETMDYLALRMVEENLKPVPSKGWAEMIRNVYEVDPMEYAVVDRIIDHLKLTFVAAKPPPPHVFTEVALPAAEESGEYF